MTTKRAFTCFIPVGERRCAFTLVELLLVIGIIALLIAIVIPSLGAARKSARAQVCMTNLRMFNTGFQSYAGDGKGLIASFSWQPGVMTPSEHANNRIVPPDAAVAHARQGVEIVRRLARDPGIIPSHVADLRFIARNYTQLVLMDGGYFGDRNPEPAVACSEDRDALVWQRLTPQQAVVELAAHDHGSPPAFLPYYSSYQIVPASFQDERGPGQIYHLINDYRLYTLTPASTRFRQRRLDAVTFPSQKVVWFDLFDRHYGQGPRFFAYPTARQPLAFFDGSVSVRQTRDANLGWDNRPSAQFASPAAAMVTYAPMNPNDPPAQAGIGAVPQYYRWTRGGIRGVDFGGGEIRK